MTQSKEKILVIEDDVEISNLIKMLLERAGYQTEVLYSAIDAEERIKYGKYDLIILDWMLPNLSGVEFLSQLRAQDSNIPVIMLTAKAQPEDIINGLETGADDYICKPFEPSVFLARVKTQLRRPRAYVSLKNELVFENIKLNTDTYESYCDGSQIQLTVSEFKILSELIRNQDKILTRDHLVRHVQGEDITVTGRTIDTHVYGLRKKLGPCASFVESIRGVGYRMHAPN